MTESIETEVALPRSVPEFEAFLQTLFEQHPDIPATISYKHAIASMLNRCGDTQTTIKLSHIADCVRAAEVKQVAYAMIQTYKAVWAEEDKKAAETLN